MTGPYEDLRAAAARREAVKENSARLARSSGTYQTTGVGDTIVDGYFDFDLTFIEEPTFVYGYALDDDSPELVEDTLPRGFAMVHGWVQDDNDFYTGAYVAFAVDVFGTDPGYIINFHVQWEGIAYKDVLRDVVARVVD